MIIILILNMVKYYGKNGAEISPSLLGMKKMLEEFQTIDQLLTIKVGYFTSIGSDVRQIIKMILGIMKKDLEGGEKKNVYELKERVRTYKDIFQIREMPLLDPFPKDFLDILIPLRELAKNQFYQNQEFRESISKSTSYNESAKELLKKIRMESFDKLNDNTKGMMNSLLGSESVIQKEQLQSLKRARIYEKSIQKNEEYYHIDKEVQKYKQNEIQLKIQIRDLTQRLSEKSIQKSKIILKQRNEHFHLDHYFKTDTMGISQEQKQFIAKQLQQYVQEKIVFTSFLYKYDKLNTTNFHKYIDDRENIVLLIRLKNGFYIAGYSSMPIRSGQTVYYKNKRGMLMNLNHKKSFKLKSTGQAVPIIFDDYFLIFGNRELKIRILDNKVSSTFGSDFGYFENYGHDSPEILFGENQYEVELVQFQIHQIAFG